MLQEYVKFQVKFSMEMLSKEQICFAKLAAMLEGSKYEILKQI
jgi:hypothetical protein